MSLDKAMEGMHFSTNGSHMNVLGLKKSEVTKKLQLPQRATAGPFISKDAPLTPHLKYGIFCLAKSLTSMVSMEPMVVDMFKTVTCLLIAWGITKEEGASAAAALLALLPVAWERMF